MALCVKDNYHTVHEAHPTGSPTEPQIIKMGCNKGVFKDILNLTISSFKTVFKKRPNQIRVWIVSWILIYCIFFIVGAGFDMVGFKFYRLQYKISSEVFSHLTSTFFVLSFLSQLFAVPLLSNHLSLSDTAIVILALIPACVGFLGEALFSHVKAGRSYRDRKDIFCAGSS